MERVIVNVQNGSVSTVPLTQEEIDALPQANSAPPKTVFAPRDYLKRFTRAEYGAARTHTNIDVQWALDNLIGAQCVDIEDPDTIAGVDLMISEGVIASVRREDLLGPGL